MTMASLYYGQSLKGPGGGVAVSQRVRSSGESMTWTVLDQWFTTVRPVEEWLEAHRSEWSPNTTRTHATSAAQWWTFLERRGEAERWNDIGVPTMTAFVSWVRRGAPVLDEIRPSGPARSDATVTARLAGVQSFYAFHKRAHQVPVIDRVTKLVPRKRHGGRGLLAHLGPELEPVSVIRVRKPRRDQPPVLLPRQIEQIVDGCATYDQSTGEWVGNLRDRFLFGLLTETGARLGEMLGMRISDWVLGRGKTPYVEIVPREDNANGARVKQMRPRRVYVSSDLERLYTDYLASLADRAQAARYPLDSASPLFLNLDRAPLFGMLKPSTVYSKVAALQKRGIGPAGWTPHWCRHTHATALLLAGVPDWVVSRRLGHAHVQTTLDLYGWVTEDAALRAAADWDRFVNAWKINDIR